MTHGHLLMTSFADNHVLSEKFDDDVKNFSHKIERFCLEISLD